MIGLLDADKTLGGHKTVRQIGMNPYVMVYGKESAAREKRDFQRWVNNRRLFHACSWNEYMAATPK